MKGKNNSSYSFFVKLITTVFELIAIWILFSRMTFFSNKITDNTLFRIIIFVCILASFAVFFYIFRLNKVQSLIEKIKVSIRKISPAKMILIIVGVGLVTKLSLLFILQIDSEKHNDFAMYWSFIKQLTTKGEITENVEYAIRFPYSLMLATVFVPFTKIFGVSTILITNVYLVILFTVGSVLIFDTVKYYKGKNIAFVASMLWVCMPLGIIEPLLLVHENGLVFFHILAIWLFFRVLPSCKNKITKLICLVIASFVISFAVLINRFAYIGIIAIAIIYFIKVLKSKEKLKSVISLVLVAVVLASSCYASNVARSKYVDTVVKGELSGPIATHEIPLAWALYVGASYKYAGAWNSEDNYTYKKCLEFDTVDEAYDYQIKIIKDRYYDLFTHPLKLVEHYNNKMGVINYPFSPINYDAGSKVNDFIMNGYNGHIQDLRMAIYSIINIYVGLALVLIVRRKAVFDKLSLYMMLFAIGNMLILIIVEAMPKYSSHLLFVYTTLIAMNYNNIMGNINSFSDKVTKALGKNIGAKKLCRKNNKADK